TPACGISSPVNFALNDRLSWMRADKDDAAFQSPPSIATRNMLNSGLRTALSASTTEAPSSSRIFRVSPSRCSSFVASAARTSEARCDLWCLYSACRLQSYRLATNLAPTPLASARSICGRAGYLQMVQPDHGPVRAAISPHREKGPRRGACDGDMIP